jgi:anti-anti-sigma factor
MKQEVTNMALQHALSPVIQDAPGDVTVIHFTGHRVSLDEETLYAIRDELFALAEEPSESDLVLDFGNVEYVASTALDTLVSLHKNLLARGRRLTIGNLMPQVHEVFAVTRLDDLLDLRLAGEEVEPAAQNGEPGLPHGVLVVDDEKAVRSVLQARLCAEGYQVWVAGHGLQAIDCYQRHGQEIAVVLLDVLMPGLDGPLTLACLQELRPTVRCCFMTGDPGPYTEEGLLAMGAVRVFQKPFAFTELIDTLNELTGGLPRRRQDRWLGTQGKECESC